MSDDKAPFTYRYRERPGEALRLEVHDDQVIVRNSKRGDRTVAFGDVKEIHLFSTMPGVYVCAIRPRQGRRVLVANRSNSGGGALEPTFRYQNDEYLKLVEKLHAAAAPFAQIRYRAGMSIFFYLMVVLLVMLALGVVALVGLMIWAIASGKGTASSTAIPAFSSLALLLIMAPIVRNILRHGRGGSYDPAKLPPDQLP